MKSIRIGHDHHCSLLSIAGTELASS